MSSIQKKMVNYLIQHNLPEVQELIEYVRIRVLEQKKKLEIGCIR